MAIKNIVKIMNFHALLRVNEARQRVEKSHEYEDELNKNNTVLETKEDYVFEKIRIAEAWSWASENVERQKFTDESLKKIEEKEEEKVKIKRRNNTDWNINICI